MPEPARVLVVDDDPLNRMMLSLSLEADGHTVVQADNGRAALDSLSVAPADLVLVDIEMPVMDGYAVLRARRDDPVLREIPFIVISAVDEMASIVQCIELGAEDYLPKPFDPVLLRARIGACLEKKRLRDQEKALFATVAQQAEELREWNTLLEQRVEEKVREVEQLRRLAGFVAPQVAEIIVSGGDTVLESHRREITVLFCDLRGFTFFAETAEPEDVSAVLREYHDAVGPLIFRYEGTLVHFTGDGMMVVFNDPLICEEPAWRAVRQAVEMRDALAGLSIEWRRRGHDLQLGVGIAIGYATCGRIGFEGRSEYTAIGTVANLSSRLCAAAEGGQILVDQRVFTLVEDRVEAEPLGVMEFKGLTRPTPTYSVTALRDVPI